jgi:cytoskeletal protein RodZ
MAIKVDVHEVEEALKIRAKYLRALENEEYNLLPGPAYIKSFLRSYADYLDLDSRALVDLYKARHERVVDDHALFPGRIENGRRFSPARRRWILAVVVVALIVLVLYLIGAATGGSGGGGA